jgi:uncharacterized protein (DUF58 family)
MTQNEAGVGGPEGELAELLAEVRRIDVQAKRLVTDVMAGGYHSVFRGMGVEFEEVREYAEGDDPRSVDWNVTARMGRPFVKKYVEERDLSVLFLLDLSASMDAGFGIWSARQTAARVCACLALSATRAGDRVGLVAFRDAVDAYVPPRKGLGHALRIVRDCLAMRGGGGGRGMAAALEFAAHAVRRKGVAFLVSDFFTEGYGPALARCARRHDLIAVRLLPPELELPPSGLWRVRDPETGETIVVDASSRRVRASHAARVASWRARTEEALRRARVDWMDVPIPRAPGKDIVARPILEFFRMRELRGTKR